MHNLGPNERVEADDGYKGEHPQHVKCPGGIANPAETQAMQARVRFRQETINKRFKHFGALKQVWRHDILLHGSVFRAIGVVLQVSINCGEKLFPVGYRDPPWEEDEGNQEAKEEEDEENGGAENAGAAGWEDQAQPEDVDMDNF